MATLAALGGKESLPHTEKYPTAGIRVGSADRYIGHAEGRLGEEPTEEWEKLSCGRKGEMGEVLTAEGRQPLHNSEC